jgi:hypothetical protein
VRIEVAVVAGDGQAQTAGQASRVMSGLTPPLDPAMPERCVRFEISNGVDPANMPDAGSVFDRYYRHPNFQNQSGMGLGLSVVKSIAQKICGEVTYRHSTGRVFFVLTVPG